MPNTELPAEEVVVKKQSRLSWWLKLLVKITVTILCFWYISRKIDFIKAENALLRANWFWLFAAICLLALSKLFSAVRLNIYFRNIQLKLSEWKNIKLYWLGMFYNLFLPGSISGDAYKVVLLKRKFNTSYKKTSAAVLLDRFSGLLALGLIMSVFGMIVLEKPLHHFILIAGSVVAIAALWLVMSFYFKDFIPGFWPTFFWGLAVQLVQVVCIYCILLSLHLPLNQPEWIFIFLVAAIVAIFPISLGGGLGTRELVFIEGAKFFHLDQQTGLVISLLFYLSTVVTSLPGIYFVFHDPVKK